MSCSISSSMVTSKFFLTSHSLPYRKNLHPASISFSLCKVSFCTFLSNFFCQNSTQLLGIYSSLHPICLCQKQPFTKTTALYFGKTISGFPCNFLTFILYRNHWLKRYFLTCTSIEVFFALIRGIFQLRFSGDKPSAIITTFY